MLPKQHQNTAEEKKGNTGGVQKAKVVESNTTEDGKVQQKAVTEDGEEIYLGFSKSYAPSLSRSCI